VIQLRPAFLLLAFALALVAAPAFGQRAGEVELRRAEQARERDVLRADARRTAAEIERLRARLVRLAREQSVDEAAALAQRARLDRLSAREQALTAALAGERARQARFLGALQNYSRNPPPALLVSPRSANDAVRAAILMRAVAPELERRARVLQARMDEVVRVRRAAALAGEALFMTESELAEQRAETEALIAEKVRLERSLVLRADAAAREAEALARRAASLPGFVGQLEARAGPALTAPRRLARPVQGALVGRFGQARSDGLTFAAPRKAQVLAPGAGLVEYAGPLKGWGGVVIVRLDGGYRAVLAGMAEVAALSGRRVAEGEPIGRMGGDAGGAEPRLYLELRRDRAPVDPAPLLDGSRVR